MVGEMGEIAAEVDGSNTGKWRCIANFAPQKTAANTGATTVVAHRRQQQAMLAPLRHLRNAQRKDESLPPL